VAPVVLKRHGQAVARFSIRAPATLQIPQEVADELRRNGSLTDGDGLGSAAISWPTARVCSSRCSRLKTLQIGDKVYGNIVATVSAPNSRVLLGRACSAG